MARTDDEHTDATRDDDREDSRGEQGESNALLVAALVGAAIGAGLGLLASRAMDEDSGVSMVLRSARKRARRELRRGAKAASEVGSAASERIGDAGDAVSELASRARGAFEDVLEREIRLLRKAARRQRRRLGL